MRKIWNHFTSNKDNVYSVIDDETGEELRWALFRSSAIEYCQEHGLSTRQIDDEDIALLRSGKKLNY